MDDAVPIGCFGASKIEPIGNLGGGEMWIDGVVQLHEKESEVEEEGVAALPIPEIASSSQELP